MKLTAQHFRHAALFCGDCVVLMLCWTLWLALGALLVLQVVIATSHELAAPGWMLRQLETRLDATGIHARFGRATFNPGGGVLLENVSLSLPEFEHPVVTARAIYLDLEPWLILAGQIEPRRLHGTGLRLYAPGMLTPSGHDEELVHDLEFTLAPGDHVFTLDELRARIAGIAVTAHGTIPWSRARSSPSVPLLDQFTKHFAAVCTQLLSATAQLTQLQEPQLDLALAPSGARGLLAHTTLTARRLTVAAIPGVVAQELRVIATLPLVGAAPAPVTLHLSADDVQLPQLTLRRPRAEIHGTFSPAKLALTPQVLEIAAAEVSSRGFVATSVAALLKPVAGSATLPGRGPVPAQVEAAVVAFLHGAPLGAAGRVDLAGQAAQLHLAGQAAPELLTPISAVIKRDIRRFFSYAAPIDLEVDAGFGPAWKFQGVAGRVSLREVDAYRVPIDAAHGEITFDGRNFVARHAFASIGEDFARGSFEQDLKTKGYRFLLEGRLRPLDIGGWFHGSWWKNIFSQFSFPDSPPEASVDVAGRWFAAETTNVFVFAESRRPIIRGATFDYVRTLLFIRPNFIDGLEVFGLRAATDLRGVFAYHFDPGERAWTKLTFDFASTLALEQGATLLGSAFTTHLSPFTFAQPPRVHVVGDFDGPGAEHGSHQHLRITAESTGDFSFHRFPGKNLGFDATLGDGEVTIDKIRAEVAGGLVTGHARVWGPEQERRLGVDAAVKGASLPQAIKVVTEYAALRQRRAASSSDKLVTGHTETKLDLALSAEGRIDDPYSFQGNGNAALIGELGQVRLLGLLSELLHFTSLRFTGARADFKIQGRKLVFPTVSITGANSAIEAHGDYALDRHDLNFNARVYPFQESKSLLSVVGFVLTPFSAVLEVKLTGPLDQPQWAFVIGPTNLFRSLSTPAEAAPAPANPPAGTPPPPSPATPTRSAPSPSPTPAKETH